MICRFKYMNQSLVEKLCSDVADGWTEERTITRQFENFQQSVEGYTPHRYQVSFFSILIFLYSAPSTPPLPHIYLVKAFAARPTCSKFFP